MTSWSAEELAEYRVAHRVACGAAWLDERIPGWWRDHNIDLSKFEMAEECRCVIGQLSPQRNYERAIAEHWLDLTTAAARSLGFLASGQWPDVDDDEVQAEYDELQHAWTVTINERRGAAEAARAEQ